MALVKREHDELAWPDRLFGRRFPAWPETWRDLLTLEGEMRVEQFQEDGTLVVRAELPGVDPDEDVEITVDDHVLQIKAERRQESKSEDKKGFRSEFRYGSYVHAVPLPVGASEDDVKASYTKGILEVRVPISAEQVAAKKVPIAHT